MAGTRPGGEVLISHPTSAREARRVAAQVGPYLPPVVAENLVLLVSEVVSNSFRHANLRADDDVVLRIQLLESSVWVEVTDPGRGSSHPKLRNSSPEGGWGLNLVERLAERWGVALRPTRVWFELSSRQATA